MKTYAINHSSAKHSHLIALLFLLLGLASSGRPVMAQRDNADDLTRPQSLHLRRRTLANAPNRQLPEVVYDLDVDITCSVPSLGLTASSCDEIPTPRTACESDNGLSSLMFMFTGGSCGESQNVQSGDGSCTDYGDTPTATSFIKVVRSLDDTSLFAGSIEIGDTFKISDVAADELHIQVFDSNPDNDGNLLQDMRFKLLCTNNYLKLNDRFGSVQVAAFTESNGQVFNSHVDVTFTTTFAVMDTDSSRRLGCDGEMGSFGITMTASDTLGPALNSMDGGGSLGSGSLGGQGNYGSDLTKDLGTYTIDLSKRSNYSIQVDVVAVTKIDSNYCYGYGTLSFEAGLTPLGG